MKTHKLAMCLAAIFLFSGLTFANEIKPEQLDTVAIVTDLVDSLEITIADTGHPDRAIVCEQQVINDSTTVSEALLADQNSWAQHTHHVAVTDTDAWQIAELTLKIEPPADVGYKGALTWTDRGVTGEDFAEWQLQLNASWAQRTAKPDSALTDQPWQVTDGKLDRVDQVDPPVAVDAADVSNTNANETDAPQTVTDETFSADEDFADAD